LALKRIYRSIGSIALGWLIGSCGDSPTGPPPPSPPTTDAVTMSAPAASLVPAASVQFSATATDRTGQILQRVFTWTSSDPTKATVSSSGMVAGVSPGTATVTAAVDGKSATSTITVLDGGMVSVSGTTLNLASGGVQIAVPSDALAGTTSLFIVPSAAFANDPRVVKGTAFDFGPTGTNFAKPVSIRVKYDPANLPPGTEEGALQIHLSVSSGWQAVEGSAVDMTAKVVTANVSHFSTYAILTPAPVAFVAIRGPPEKPVVESALSFVVGESEQLTATLTDSDGQILSNRAVAWASSDPAIVSVTSSGLVAAVIPGSATVSASAGGGTSSITVTVTPVPVSSVAVTLSPQTITVGQTSQAAALLSDLHGNLLEGRAVTWASSNTSVATVNPATGVVTALAPGSATITGTSEGESGTSTIIVTPAPVALVIVSLIASPIAVGGTTTAAATTLDANSNVLAGRAVAWSSDNTAVATVSSTGVVTAVSTGTATITATSEGKSGSATITVTLVPVASVSVSLTTTSVQAGQTTQATATTLDASGGTLAGRAIVWASSNTAVATVSTGGLVTTISAGTSTITATSEGKTGSATLTVTPVPVASVTVTPSSASVVEGGTVQLSAETRDADNNLLTGRAETWVSTNTAAATVSPSGLVSGVAAGTAQITVTSEGKSATATITVTLVPVASVSVSLAATSVQAGQTTQASATTRDASDNVVIGRVVTWSSDAQSVATVNATSGLVTAVGAGPATITAQSEGKTGSATVTVTPIPVATVAVTLTPSTLTAVETAEASAVTLDASGGTLTGRAIAWSTSNPFFATVSSTGLVTAVSAGTANIIAISEGKSGSATLTVTPAPVTSATVSPASASVTAGTTQQLTATLRDVHGNVLSGRSVIWSSSNNSLATVSSTGLVTAIASGTVTIIATSEGQSGTSSINVTPVPVGRLPKQLRRRSVAAVRY